MNGVGLCVRLALQVSLDSDKSDKSVVLETRLVVSHSPLCVTDMGLTTTTNIVESMSNECCKWVRYKWADPSNYQTEEYTWIQTTLDTFDYKKPCSTQFISIYPMGHMIDSGIRMQAEVPGMFRKGLKQRSWHCASISQNYIWSQSHVWLVCLGSLHEVPLSIENYIFGAWLVIGADYCKVECGHVVCMWLELRHPTCPPAYPCPCPFPPHSGQPCAKPCPHPCPGHLKLMESWGCKAG